MSHFSVLVIGENVVDQLEPYHEFECTGIDNEYVVNVDETDDYRNRYNSQTKTMLKSPDGSLHEPYDGKFYRDPTSDELREIGIGGIGITTVNEKRISFSTKDWGDGKGYRPKVKFTPDGWEEVKVPYSETMSFKEYVEQDFNEGFFVNSLDELDLSDTHKHKYGWGLLDSNGNVVKVVNRTNPNRKWDWYQIGGRWAGRLPIKPEFQREYIGNTPNFSWGWNESDKVDTIQELRQDRAVKGHIDFNLIRDKARKRAEETYDYVYNTVLSKSERGRTWNDVLNDTSINSIDEKRKLYNEQPIVVLFTNAGKDNNLIDSWDDKVEDFYISREEYIQKEINSSFSTYAIVRDGVWYEKGEMGWFGLSDDKMTQQEWNKYFTEVLDSLTDDTLLTIVDCHI
jgi:hypothetical protein